MENIAIIAVVIPPSLMHYDLGYSDDETCRLEPLQSPFGPKVLPMSPE